MTKWIISLKNAWIAHLRSHRSPAHPSVQLHAGTPSFISLHKPFTQGFGKQGSFSKHIIQAHQYNYTHCIIKL